MTAEAAHFRHSAELAELTALALAIRDEVRDEPEEGRVALAFAAMNRMKRFGPERAGETCPNFNDRAFCRAFAAACLAASGDLADPTGGATHFHLHTDEPFWASAATPKALIGRHIFYALDRHPSVA
jgi:spore germination cell wall hydrolase CwlJ-like protein